MANPFQKIRDFYTNTVTELKKCTWPTRQDLVESTLVVIVSAILLSAFVFVADVVIRTVVRVMT